MKDFDAVVFGLFETGLGVARSLGKKGVRVLGIDHKKDLAWFSKYVQPVKCPHPISESIEFIAWIKENFISLEHKVPIFLTSDDFAIEIANNWEILHEYFLINWIDSDFLQKISDKQKQYELALDAGIPVPYTSTIFPSDQLDSFTFEDHRFPVFIKGLDVNLWRRKVSGTTKGYSAESVLDAKKLIHPIIKKNTPVIVQDLIEGSDSNHFKYCCYIGTNGEFNLEFILQKIRQNPVHFGVGATVKSVNHPELKNLGRRLFQRIGYKGIGSAEFKFDQKSKTLKLIEINPRYWQQNYLATFCGMNFPIVNYYDLLDLPFETSSHYDVNKKWVNRYMDFDSFLEYRKEGSLTFRDWRKSLNGDKVFADFLWSDPVPALFELRFGLRLFKIPSFLIKKILRS